MNFAIDKFDSQRFGLITGSEVGVLFPEKGSGKAGQISYAKKLANQRYFQFYDELSTWQTRHGEMSEAFALVNFQTFINKDAEQGEFKRIGEYGGTCDCLCPEYGVDFKCPTSLENWLNYLHEGISKQQYWQAQMYMWLFAKPKWIVSAFLIETEFMSNNGLVYPIPEEHRSITVEVEKMPYFDEELHKRGQFVLDLRDEFINQLKQRFQ